MRTLEDYRRYLHETFDAIDNWCRFGSPDFYTGLEAVEMAEEAQRLACRFGCDVAMIPLHSPQDALQLLGRLLAWAEAQRTKDRPLTVPEVARHLRVRPDKVLAWVHSGRLRGYNVAEKENGRPKYRINREDLEAFTMLRVPLQTKPAGRPVGSRSLPKKELTWSRPDTTKRKPR